MRTKLVAASLLASSALFAAPAFAFEMRSSTWATNTVTIQVNSGVPGALPTHYAKLLDAEAKIDNNASALRFDLVVDNDAVSAVSNGENELNFTSDPALLCGSIGCTWIIEGGGQILEADSYFDINYAWTLDDNKWNSIAYDPTKKRPLINTAMHELLHTMGAKHENDCINIMGNAWNVVSTNGDHTEVVVSEDTTSGLIAVNGQRAGTVTDVSVMHWQLDPVATGASAYSAHRRSRLLDAAGALLPLAFGYPEPTYEASPGQVIQVEMTLENRGTASQTPSLGTYWSTNETITTGDTLLSATSPVLNVNVPYETTRTVTIPVTAVPGQVYWVGAIVDRTSALTESNKVNNAAYIAAIEVQ